MVTNELNKVTYTGDGSQTSFEITFPVLTDGNKNAFGIAVALLRITGETVYLVKDTDYSVSGKNIVAVVAPSVAEKLMIYRQNEQTQKIDFVNNDAIDADILELALDKLTMSVQELSERTNRVVTQEITDGEASLVFPPAAARANAFLSFDENGNIDVQTGAYPRTWYIGFPFRLNEICQHNGLFYKSKHDNNSGNEPPAIGETSSHWDEFKTGGKGGMPNYIDDRAGSYTAETGFSITTDTSSEAINKDGCIKVVKDAVNREGTGWHQDVLISDTDLNSLLQLDFWLKSTDTDKLNVRIYDLDADPDVVIFDSVIVDVAEKNPITGIYYFSQDVQTSGSKNYRTQFYMNSNSAAAMTFWTSEVSLGQPYRFTVPNDALPVGATFPYQGIDLPSANYLFSSGPEQSQAEYPELYAVVKDRWNAERQAHGWPAPTAGYFYPGPSAGHYFRSAILPEQVASTAVDYGIQAIPLNLPSTLRPGTPIIIIGDDLPNELTSGTQYYLRHRTGTAPAYFSLYSTGALAIASISGSGRIAFTDSGSGTFQFIQVSGFLEDAFKEHSHNSIYANDFAADPGPGTAVKLLRGAASPPDNDFAKTPVALNGVDSVNTSNETRPTTSYMTYIVLAKPIHSVELMKLQTSRNDAGGLYYDYEAPTAGKNRDKDLAFDGTTVHNWADYDQLLSRKTELISAGIFETTPDPSGSQFVLKEISPSMGWRTVYNNPGNTSNVSLSVGAGTYKVWIGPSTMDAWYTAFVVIGEAQGAAYNYLASWAADQVMTYYNYIWYSQLTGYGVQKIEKLEEVGYAYLRTKSLSAVILAEVFDDTDFEHEITTATDVVYTLANLSTKKEYTFNRYGAGTGALKFIGNLYWPDGTFSTDFALEGNGWITIKYIGGKWRVREFTDDLGTVSSWRNVVKGINGYYVSGYTSLYQDNLPETTLYSVITALMKTTDDTCIVSGLFGRSTGLHSPLRILRRSDDSLDLYSIRQATSSRFTVQVESDGSGTWEDTSESGMSFDISGNVRWR